MSLKKMLFYYVALILLFLVLLQNKGSPAACLYEFEGLDASISINSDVLRGQAVYAFNITENGTLSSQTATMNTATSLFTLENNTFLVHNCSIAGTNEVLEVAVLDDRSCSPRYLNVSVEAANPIFDMCTNAEVVYNEVNGYVHFMELKLRNNHRCAKFKCYASLTNPNGSFEIIIYAWIMKANASNEIIIGKTYSMVVACHEDSQPYADKHSIEIDIRFTNTSTAKCYNYSTTAISIIPTTASVKIISSFVSSSDGLYVSSPNTKEPTQISLSTYMTKAPMLHSSMPAEVILNITRQMTVLTSLAPSSYSTPRPTTQSACCSENGYGFFQTRANIVALAVASCFGAIGATAAGIYMLWSRACGAFSKNKLHPLGCRQ